MSETGAETGLLARASVQRVQSALAGGGSAARVRDIGSAAHTAEAAALAIGCELGAIVKSLVFTVDGAPVIALVAGDKRCDLKKLGEGLGIPGKVARADADLVRAATGFAIGGVAPLGYPAPLPTAIDASLSRFATIYPAGGHPNAIFATSLDELSRLTGGRVVDGLGH